MALAHSLDLVDVILIAVLLLAYAGAFCLLFAVVKIRERKARALHRKRLDQILGKAD